MRAGEHVTAQVRLVRPIGAGGMGAVWVGEHLALKTEVAVKFILAGREQDGEARERFTREAEAAAQVKSPHVAQIFDHGLTEDGIPFIVMELLEGEDLSRYLHARGRLTMRETANIVTQTCRALQRAHSRGLVHRDVKPANIFMCDVGTPERFVKLLDFGVAKMVGGGSSTATKSGSVTGTPVYMAPEQLLGAKDLDGRADQWSVAVVAYEMMVGRRPLIEENAAAIGVRLHTRGMPKASEGLPELSPGAAAAIDAFFQKAWALDPKDRHETPTALAEHFEAMVQAIQEAEGAQSGFFLPARQSIRGEGDMLTIRETGGDARSKSDVTLQSGRLQIVEPLPITMAAPPSSIGPAPLHTESALSRQVMDSKTGGTPVTPKGSVGTRVAALAAVVVVLGGAALLLRARETPKEAVKDAASTPSVNVPPRTSTSAPATTATTTSSAQPSTTAAPVLSASVSATVSASTTAKTTPTNKKPPAGTASASAAPTGKKLEDIE